MLKAHNMEGFDSLFLGWGYRIHLHLEVSILRRVTKVCWLPASQGPKNRSTEAHVLSVTSNALCRPPFTACARLRLICIWFCDLDHEQIVPWL